MNILKIFNWLFIKPIHNYFLGEILGTVGAVAGPLLGYQGTKDTNSANADIASARNAMEVEEAAKARAFSADQATINRDFQQAQVLQKQAYDERMSSTAVQRRMEDMKAGGINPILASKFDASSPASTAAAGNIGATAKANAHGYEARNKIEGAMNSAMNLTQLAKLLAETRSIDQLYDIKNPAAKVARIGSSALDKVPPFVKKLNKFGANLGSSAYDLKITTEKAIKQAVDRVIQFTKNPNPRGDKLRGDKTIDKSNWPGTKNNPIIMR